MAMFSGIAERLFAVVGQLRPSSDRLPLTKAKWIWSESVTTRTGDNDLDSVVSELAADSGELVGLEGVKAAVQDIIVGDVVDHNWQNVNSDGSEGGVGENHDTTNAAARGATYSAPSFSDGNTDNFILIRIPRNSDVRHYQIVISGVEGAIGANLLLALGHSVDNNWSYYGYGYAEINAFAGASHTVTLQISDRVLAHTTFAGKLGTTALEQVRSEAETQVDALETEVDALETRVDVVTTRVDTLETGGLGLRRVVLSNNTGVNLEGVTFPYSGRLDHASAQDLVYAELSDGTNTWVMKYKGVSAGGNIEFEDAGENGREIHFQPGSAGVRLFVKDDNADTTLSAELVFADGLFAPRLIPLNGQIDNHHLIWSDSANTSTWNNPGRILTADAADAIYQGLLVAPYWKRLEMEIEYSAGDPALFEYALATIATVREGGGGKENNRVRLHGIAFMGALLDIQINLVTGGQIRADNSHLKISGVTWASGSETFNGQASTASDRTVNINRNN